MFSDYINNLDPRTQGERNTIVMIKILNDINNKLDKLISKEDDKPVEEIKSRKRVKGNGVKA